MANTKKVALKSSNSLKSIWQRRKVPIIIVLVLFASVGAYMIKSSGASTFMEASLFGYGCTSTPTIGQGNQGPCVTVVQQGLNNWSEYKKRSSGSKTPYNYVPLKVDGVFGASTKAKVIEFQQAKATTGKNIAADGVVGPATWVSLQADCSVWVMCYDGVIPSTGK
jgi:peptidoglycan hydrolase-like protein with peptidoglycan-binding domain